jgi:hypothetical protein
MKRVYIAGPMSNLPQFNFPAFYAAAEALRAAGYDVISPAELDDAEDSGAAMQSPDGDMRGVKKTWGDFLARDVKLLVDEGVTGIVFLPGWEKSKGAKLEAFVGVLAGLEFATFELVDDVARFTLIPRATGWVLNQIAGQYAAEMTTHAPIKRRDTSKRFETEYRG